MDHFLEKFSRSTTMRWAYEARLLPADFRPTRGFSDVLSMLPELIARQSWRPRRMGRGFTKCLRDVAGNGPRTAGISFFRTGMRADSICGPCRKSAVFRG